MLRDKMMILQGSASEVLLLPILVAPVAFATIKQKSQ
jgi:hypothetical protein